MEQSKDTIAMLIDADNSPSDKIDFILAELAQYGVVNIRRAYGNWKSRSLSGWEDKLHDYAIRPIQQFDYTKGKNATDMAMTIDAMDLLYGSKLDAFCIVSSDSDFTPLVMRILAEGLHVYGFGQKSTPSPFVNACSTFLYLESVGVQEKSKSDGGRRKSGQELKGDSKLLTLIRNAVDSAQEEDGWSNLAKIGKNISNQASFDPRNYGFKRLSDLVRSIDLFEFEFRNKNSELYVRDKRKAKRPEQGTSEPEAELSFAEAMRPTTLRTEPVVSEPVAEDLAPAEPVVIEPVIVESAAVEPVIQEPVSSEPARKKPARRKPTRSKPAVRTESVPAEPAAAEPSVVEPVAVESVTAEPEKQDSALPAEPQERPRRKPRRPARKKAEAEMPPAASSGETPVSEE
ncbi:MAG: NYN domain-containing protein [Chlorobiaceae bacterium]|nr:NYN domain-containing protein [Chlorobiaceae bacterium]NTV26990.1 NYN domain-containing protein [Chlorobiaceae bacterium]